MSKRSVVVVLALAGFGIASLLWKVVSSSSYTFLNAVQDTGIELLNASLLFVLFSLAVDAYEARKAKRGDALASLEASSPRTRSVVDDLANGRRLVLGSLFRANLDHIQIDAKRVSSTSITSSSADSLVAQQSTFKGVSFVRTSLKLALFDRCQFKRVDFTDCELAGVLFTECDFDSRSRLTSVREVRELRFSECTFSPEFLLALPQLSGAQFIKCPGLSVEDIDVIIRQGGQIVP